MTPLDPLTSVADALRCPTEEELQEYLLHSFPAWAEVHLTDCPACRQRLDTVAGARFSPAGSGSSHTSLKWLGLHTEPDSHIVASAQAYGDYRVIRKIGRGGMGNVLECEDMRLNRRVAVKTIRPDKLTPLIIRRMGREARNQAVLNHPNIVSVLEFGTENGWPYLVMEYVPGQSLRQKIREFPLAPRQAATILAQVAEAVGFAHERGILHRDLKPSNILIIDPNTPSAEDPSGSHETHRNSADWIPKVTDFGLSIAMDADHDLTHSNMVLGTPAYMSPEMTLSSIDGGTPASDIYALGVVLYESLTGRPPFQAENSLQTLALVRDQLPVSPRTLIPGLPRDLETICLKCLEKEPDNRYSTAMELALDLRRFLDLRPIAARPLGLWHQAWRWCRRNRHVAAAMSVATVSVLSLVAGSILFAYSQIRFANEQSRLRLAAETSGEMAKAQSRQTKLAELEARQQRDMARRQFVASSRVLYNIGNMLAFSVFNTNPSDELKGINRQFQEQVLALSEDYLKRPDLAGDSPELLPMSIYNAARAHRLLGHGDEAIRHYEWLLSFIRDSTPPTAATESYRILAASGTLELAEMYDARNNYVKAIALLEPFWQKPVNPQDNQPFPEQTQDYKRVRAIFGGKLLPIYQRANQPEKANAMRRELEETTRALLQNP